MDYLQGLIVQGIKRLMEKRQWSKADLARVCKIAKQNVNSYLTGKLNPENLLLPLYESGEDIEWIKHGGRDEGIVSDNKPNFEGITYWESRTSHFTEKERKDLNRFINELIKEMNESKEKAEEAIDVARVILKKGRKKKQL